MKIIFLTASLLLFLGFNAFAQVSAVEVGVETITLTRDDGSGKPGEATDIFSTRDIPIRFTAWSSLIR